VNTPFHEEFAVLPWMRPRRTRSGHGSGPPDSITDNGSGEWLVASGERRSAARADPKFVIPTGAARLFPPRRIMARRVAQWRDLLFSCLLIAGHWSLITLPRGWVAHPCGSGFCKGGSRGVLFLLRGSDIYVRHTSTPKKKNSPNSLFPLGVRRISPFRSGKELLARKPSLPRAFL